MPKPRRKIKLGETTIPFNTKVKYLGIWLDESLTFKYHTQKTKAWQKNGLLYPLLNRKSKMSLNNKITIYKTIIQPTILYGATIWSKAPHTHKYKLQIIQNKTLRMITNAPYYVSNRNLHTDLKIKTINQIAEERKETITSKVVEHRSLLIKKILLDLKNE